MTADQKQEIIRLRRLGYTQIEVASLVGMSARTIKRVEKEESKKEEGEDSNFLDDAFEDSEEGWVMRYTRELGACTPESKSWNFIVYDESAPPGWFDDLLQLGCPIMRGLHDSCKWLTDSKNGKYKKGDLKKIHWHCNIKFPKKINLKRAAMIIQRITHGPVPKSCPDEFGLIMYLQHLHKNGEPIENKTQYSADIIEFYNGWEPERSEMDKLKMQEQLEKYLIGLTNNYALAVTLVNKNLGREYGTLMRRSSYHYRSIIDSNRWLSAMDMQFLNTIITEEEMLASEAEQHWEEQNLDLENQEEITL